MSLFFAACAVLVILSAVFLLFPRRRVASEGDVLQANLEWYRIRAAELDERGEQELEEDVRLRLLEDTGGSTGSLSAGPNFRPWWLLPVVVLAAAGIYWELGGAPDVAIAEVLDSLDETTPPDRLDSLLDDIRERSAQRPENLRYLGLMGQLQMAREDYEGAANTYLELADAAPQDAQALAYAAQASFLADDRNLDERAQLLAERALAIDPHQRTALGLLGMSAFEREQYAAAATYWERLRATEQPGSPGDQMLADVIATARERAGLPASQPDPAPAPAAGSVSLAVSIVPPPDTPLPADATVFVLARRVDAQTRMPLAVRRLRVADLSAPVRLDDSHGMAGQRLSGAGQVQVAVQVSPSGQPGVENAAFLAESAPVEPTAQGTAVRLQLQPVQG